MRRRGGTRRDVTEAMRMTQGTKWTILINMAAAQNESYGFVSNDRDIYMCGSSVCDRSTIGLKWCIVKIERFCFLYFDTFLYKIQDTILVYCLYAGREINCSAYQCRKNET
eukprot:TRINITY_DN44310_c0_g1_i2.p1 TRINITY_DN44310_c0_g1~~TRINITY_DN44310_c0_g1_i2.p1  ORF type:complete len:111 (+),score=2.66 TRINITY_DN44310_c0_g1_i2:277-609(+)